jgi:hypothetical protein
MSEQTGARLFRITVDGLTRAYRLTAEAANEAAAVIKAKSPDCEVAVRDMQGTASAAGNPAHRLINHSSAIK